MENTAVQRGKVEKVVTTQTTTHGVVHNVHPDRTFTTGREVRKEKGKNGLLLAAAVVALATLITIGSTYYFAEKAKHGVEHGIDHLEHGTHKGQKPSVVDRAKQSVGYHGSRQQALEGLRESLGVKDGKPIDSHDIQRLQDLLILDQYTYDTEENQQNTWSKVKTLLGLEAGKKLSKEALQSLRETLTPHKSLWERTKEKAGYPTSNTQKAKNAAQDLADSAQENSDDLVQKIRDILGVQKNKAIGEETVENLRDILGLREPTLWEKTKAKISPRKTATQKLQDGAQNLADTAQYASAETIQKIRDVLGVDKNKAIGQETVENLRDLLGFREPTLYERAKEKVHPTSATQKAQNAAQNAADSASAASEETLLKIRQLLGVDKNKAIGQETVENLRDILGLREATRWERTKAKFVPQKDNTQKIKEVLGVDKNKAIGEDTLLQIKELLGVDSDKAIGEETYEYLRDSLAYEPSLWERTKAQLSRLQDDLTHKAKHTKHSAQEAGYNAKHSAQEAGYNAKHATQDAAQSAKHGAQDAAQRAKHGAQDATREPLLERVKEKVGLHSHHDHDHDGVEYDGHRAHPDHRTAQRNDQEVEKLIEEARHKAEESQDILRKAYATSEHAHN